MRFSLTCVQKMGDSLILTAGNVLCTTYIDTRLKSVKSSTCSPRCRFRSPRPHHRPSATTRLRLGTNTSDERGMCGVLLYSRGHFSWGACVGATCRLATRLHHIMEQVSRYLPKSVVRRLAMGSGDHPPRWQHRYHAGNRLCMILTALG